MSDFYDRLTPYFHLIFEDWDASMAWQADRLAGIIREVWGDRVQTVLDVSCGIGTQAIALAGIGFDVTASDLSEQVVERARAEAGARGVEIDFSVCDMRAARDHHARAFDLVISCDNSVPHLLSDREISTALKQLFDCTRPGGGCLLTVRDYDEEERGTGLVKPYGVRQDGEKRYVIFQVWDFEGDRYDLAMYFVEDDEESSELTTHVMRSRYYAIGTERLMELMRAAGFEEVRRIDYRYYQPVLVGTRPE